MEFKNLEKGNATVNTTTVTSPVAKTQPEPSRLDIVVRLVSARMSDANNRDAEIGKVLDSLIFLENAFKLADKLIAMDKETK